MCARTVVVEVVNLEYINPVHVLLNLVKHTAVLVHVHVHVLQFHAKSNEFRLHVGQSALEPSRR